MAYITCKNLTLGYDGKAIVDGLNFQINKGDYLCIVGENGAGKSTLVKTLLGLTNAMGGEIVRGDGLGVGEIGYLPQQTVIQRDFPATVWEVVLSGTLSHLGKKPFYGKAERKLAAEKLSELGISDLKDETYRNLSGGQQQRVLLARALCATSKVILLDEPVTGLDPKVTLDFYQIINNLNENGVTVIMVSHDLQALSYASHVLHISRDGSFYGTRGDYMKQDLAKHFLPWDAVKVMEENAPSDVAGKDGQI
jgi:zinc transport system ATP-binding protein